MYENWGLMLHGLNRYYLIVGLEISVFNFTKDRTVDYFTNFKEHCDNLEENKRVQDICLNIWPLYFYYRNEELKYQKQIMSILTYDLPAVLPSFVPPDFGNFDSSFKQLPTILIQFNHFYEKANDNSTLIQNTKLVALQQNHESDTTDKGRRRPLNIQTPTTSTSRKSLIDHQIPSEGDDPFGTHDMTDRRSNLMSRNTHLRHKRFDSSLTSLAVDGFKLYMAHKRDQKLQKTMQMLLEKQKRLDFRIESVEDDMMSIAKASLHEINHMKTTIKNTNSRIDFMGRR